MKFENSCVIEVPRPKLWDYMTAIPNVAKCVPGVEEVNVIEEGKYSGMMTLKVGVVKLRMSGKISVELMDKGRHIATMSVQAADECISGLIQGRLTMNLEELAAEETKLTVQTDLNLFGKIGEFGQPIIKRKAEQMMAEFAKNVASGVAGVPLSGGNREDSGSTPKPSEDPV